MKCTCGETITPDTVFCRCGCYIDHYAVQPDAVPTGLDPQPDPPAPPANPGPGDPGAGVPLAPEPVVTGPRPCAVDWCTGTIAPGASACDAYGHAAPTTPAATAPAASATGCWVLALPDGTEIDLADGVEVEVGRHSPDPRIASGLAAFDAVGRRQATLRLQGGEVVVTHVGRTNPTYANGRAAAPTVRVTPPVDLQIGRELHLTVRRKGDTR